MSLTLESDTKTQSFRLKLDVEVLVKWLHEEIPDLSHIGEYTSKEVDGAIDCREHGRNYREGHTFRWFVSANHGTFNEENWSHVSKKEKDECITKYGSLEKTEAHYALEDFKRMDAYNNDDWRMTGCRVTLRLGSMEAEDSLWGIESDCGDEYRRATEKEMISNAFSALEKKILARLTVE
jgi:hypothetical protein